MKTINPKNSSLMLVLALALVGCVKTAPEPMVVPPTQNQITPPVQEEVEPAVEFEDVLEQVMEAAPGDFADFEDLPEELKAEPTEEEVQAMIEKFEAMDEDDQLNPEAMEDFFKSSPLVTKMDMEKREEFLSTFQDYGLDVQDSYGRMKALCGFDLSSDEFDQAISYYFNRGQIDLPAILGITSSTDDWTAEDEIQVLQVITGMQTDNQAAMAEACRGLFEDLRDNDFGYQEFAEEVGEEEEFIMPDSEEERAALTNELAVDPSTLIIEGRDADGNLIDGLYDEEEMDFHPPTTGMFDGEAFPDQDLPTPLELGVEIPAGVDPSEVQVTAGTAALEQMQEIGGDGLLFTEEQMEERMEAINQFMSATPAMEGASFEQVIAAVCEVELDPERAGIFISRVFVERDHDFGEVMNVYQNDALSDSGKQEQILGMVLGADNSVEENVASCQAVIADIQALDL